MISAASDKVRSASATSLQITVCGSSGMGRRGSPVRFGSGVKYGGDDMMQMEVHVRERVVNYEHGRTCWGHIYSSLGEGAASG